MKMKLLMENWKQFIEQEQPEAAAQESPAAQWLAKNIAPLLSAEGGDSTQLLSALVDRLNSPEGMSDEVRTLLSLGDLDGDASDEAIKVQFGAEIPATSLKPTQGVIDLFKSVGYNGSIAEGLKSVLQGVSGAPPILVCGSGNQYFIIDGHHRWSGAAVFNPTCKIPANVIVMDPKKALLISQLSIAAWQGGGKKLPSLGAKKGRSIIGPDAMSEDAVYEALMSNVGKVIDRRAGQTFMNSKVIAVIGGFRYGQQENEKGMRGFIDRRNPPGEEEELQEVGAPGSKLGKRKEKIVRGAITEIAANCQIVKAEAAKGGAAPPREVMPQFDPDVGGPDFKSDIAADLQGGKLNYMPKFDKAAE